MYDQYNAISSHTYFTHLHISGKTKFNHVVLTKFARNFVENIAGLLSRSTEFLPCVDIPYSTQLGL